MTTGRINQVTVHCDKRAGSFHGPRPKRNRTVLVVTLKAQRSRRQLTNFQSDRNIPTQGQRVTHSGRGTCRKVVTQSIQYKTWANRPPEPLSTSLLPPLAEERPPLHIREWALATSVGTRVTTIVSVPLSSFIDDNPQKLGGPKNFVVHPLSNNLVGKVEGWPKKS